MQSWSGQGSNPDVDFCQRTFYKKQVNSTEMGRLGKGVKEKCQNVMEKEGEFTNKQNKGLSEV